MRQGSIKASLLLGSNIQPQFYLPEAAFELARIFPVLKISSVWESAAVGSQGPNFYNAALLILTSDDPSRLKTAFLRPLEARLGRVRTSDKNAPRTIDIDITTWGDKILDPNLWKYAHIAVPVAELLPGFWSGKTHELLESTARRLMNSMNIRLRRDISLSGIISEGPSSFPQNARFYQRI